MAHKTTNHGVFPDPNVGPMDLAQVVQGLNKVAAETRWTFKELQAFQAHASKWYNTLQGNWLFGDVPSDLPALVQVVRGLLDWSDETMGMIEDLRAKRKVLWAKYLMLPFELRHTVSGMMYRFGCPSLKEEPEGLRDAFSCAKTLLEKCTTPAPSVEDSKAQVEDQAMLDLTADNTAPLPDQQEMELDTTAVISAATAVAHAAPIASVVPIAPAASAPVVPAVLVAPTPVVPATHAAPVEAATPPSSA
ncbi:unnamed protein product, partial [Rhizoctonia solani]